MDVKSGAALVVERLGHEGGELVLLPGQLLDRGLEPERPVGGVERLGVPQVDLELAAGELVVGRDDLQPVRGQLTQGAEQHVLRITLETGDVDVAGAPRRSAANRSGCCVGAFHHVELELRARRWAACPSSANWSITRFRTARGLSADGVPSGLNMSAMTCATPGSHGTGGWWRCRGRRPRPAGRRPCRPRSRPRRPSGWCRRRTGRTRRPSPTVRAKRLTSRSRPRSVPIRSA